MPIAHGTLLVRRQALSDQGSNLGARMRREKDRQARPLYFCTISEGCLNEVIMNNLESSNSP